MNNSTTEIKVRGYHLDVYQHVNNARYLELLEEARWRYYEEYPTEYFAAKGWGFIIVNININYKSSAVLGDVLQINTSVKRIGEKSVTFHQVITKNGTDKVVVDADVTFVMIDIKTGKTLAIEGDLKDVLLKEKVL